MTKKQTLIVMWQKLTVGGVEKNAVDMIANALSNDNRVIWIGNKKKIYSQVYANVIENPGLEFIGINYSRINLYNIPKIKFKVGETITILTFDIVNCFVAYKFKEKYNKYTIKVLYIVPHFVGDPIFLEQTFHGHFSSLVKKHSSIIYKELYDNGCLRFFGKKHAIIISNNYGINLPNYEERVVPQLTKRNGFNFEHRKKVFHNPLFTIVSAGRFEFPHKGFVLGLIKDMPKVIAKYNNIRPLIIGDGRDKDQVLNYVSSLDEETRNHITVHPPVDPKTLESIIKDCNLSISVSGCATLSAKCGVLTLPARHYSTTCEVYGFTPESKNKTLCSEPGFPVLQYIFKAYEMSEDEYIKRCYTTFHSYDNEKADLNYPLDQSVNIGYIPSKLNFAFINIVYFLQRILYFLNRFYKK